MDWQGVFPALMTEFKPDGTLDLAAMQKHPQARLDVGCRDLMMTGMDAEWVRAPRLLLVGPFPTLALVANSRAG